MSPRSNILSIDDQRSNSLPAISVVVVAYRTGPGLLRCVESIFAQLYSCFELIVVDNGGNSHVHGQLMGYPLLLIQLAANNGPSRARNIGLRHARAEVVCFLDDDAIADQRLLASHLEAHQQPGVVGVRGKVVPQHANVYNQLAEGYDLGERRIAAAIDVEGNSSWKRSIVLTVGGFNEAMFGHEGSELSLRIVRATHDPWCLQYEPGAIIYHDYTSGLVPYLKKTARHAWSWARLDAAYPEIYDLMRLYRALRPPRPQPPRPASMRMQIAVVGFVTRTLARITHKLALFKLRRRSSNLGRDAHL